MYVVLAMLWGFVWAAVLQYTDWGRRTARERTWITVVIGVGGNLAILYFAIDPSSWWTVVAIFVASSIGIIGRSLFNERAAE